MNDPDSENGVVSLFSKVHSYLGFPFIKEIGSRFPDCTVVDEKGKEARIEFEKLSSEFNHDPGGCDCIVCWKDDAGKFAKVKVLELEEFIYGHE